MMKLRSLIIKMFRHIALALTIMMVINILPLAGSVALAADNGMIRVKLTRLGSPSSITMKTTGDYVIAGIRVSSGSTIKITNQGSKLAVESDGKTLASGASLAMVRTDYGLNCGVKFSSPALSNLFCGDLTFIANGNTITTILSIYIETYLYGVVPYEMSNSYPIEALKAQAIAARTYAMRAKSSSGTYDLTDNTTSQVFKGYNSAYSTSARAVNETRGVCLMSGSSYASCYYTASNGGQTESAKNAWGSAVSYLIVKDDPYDLENPSSTVRRAEIAKNGADLNSSVATKILSAASAQLNSAGLSDAKIKTINSAALHSPRYAEPSRTYSMLRLNVTFSGANDKSLTTDVDVATYGNLESVCGLSINSGSNETISIDEKNDCFVLSFRRFGHGVGLSQTGAQWMAAHYGKTYAQILEFYYPGTSYKTFSYTESLGSSEAIVPTPVPIETEFGYTTLREGDSGEEVKALQKKLLELGYFDGNPLGNYKTLTTAAVKAFQKANGMEENGVASPLVQKMIFESAVTATLDGYETLKYGDTGDKVKALQAKLKELGYFTGNVAGNYLSITETAVKSYQTAQGLKADGVATAELQKMIFESTTAVSPTVTPEITPTPAPTEVPSQSDYSTLKYGDSGEKVKALQSKLKELGYFTGNVAGNYLSLTEAAVKRYQTANGQTANGVASPELQKMIFETVVVTPTVQPEAEKQAVISLENASSRLNIRKEANTTSGILGTLSNGQTVTVTGTSGAWSAIKAAGVNGYVMTKYLKETGTQPTPAPSSEPQMETTQIAYVMLSSASSTLNIRADSSSSAVVIGTLSHGQKVTVKGQEGSWSFIEANGMTGYVQKSYLSANAPELPNESEGNYSTLKYGNTGENVKALQRKLKELGYFGGSIGGNYYSITEGAVKAFQKDHGLTQDGIATPSVQQLIFSQTVSNSQTTESTETYKAVVSMGNASSKLNVRSQPSTSSQVLGTLSNGQTVTVTGSSGSWKQITVGSLSGYVAGEYLKKGSSSSADQATPQPQTTLQPNADSGTLQYGDSGESVKALQRKLKELGYFTGNIGGNYLTLTESAVKAYQAAKGLKQDGVATAQLQARIFAENSAVDDTNAVVVLGSESYLNMRSEPAVSSQRLAKLYAGTRVKVIESNGDWYKISYNGTIGYAIKSCIVKD